MSFPTLMFDIFTYQWLLVNFSLINSLMHCKASKWKWKFFIHSLRLQFSAWKWVQQKQWKFLITFETLKSYKKVESFRVLSEIIYCLMEAMSTWHISIFIFSCPNFVLSYSNNIQMMFGVEVSFPKNYDFVIKTIFHVQFCVFLTFEQIEVTEKFTRKFHFCFDDVWKFNSIIKVWIQKQS